MSAKLEAYRDRRGDFRWRVQAENGRVLADSGEGYKNWGDLLDAYDLVYYVLDSQDPVRPPRTKKRKKAE